MTISSSGNSSLDALSNSYQSTQGDKTQKEDALGRDTFLTMLVAQLQNQDPLNPMEGSDFSAQLAQFSQLEQLMSLNESMDNLAGSFSNDSEKDLVSYIGKQVTGRVESMDVKEGQVSGGFFSLSETAEVMVAITDASGKTVKTLSQGTKGSGTHLIEWDGTDTEGNAVPDGTYQYTVLANNGTGYKELPTTVTGTVDGIAYSNENPYLVVQGVLVDPDSLTSVIELDDNSQSVESVMGYLGNEISSEQPIVSVENGLVTGTDLSFELEQKEAAVINIYDPWDNLVQTLTIDEATAAEGENTVSWNAVGDTGYPVEDGLYYYTVETASGTGKTSVSEEVSGIKYANGSQYLELKDSGRLVAISSITAIN
jgi:flagellar basal-body rod modification protein FlgD